MERINTFFLLGLLLLLGMIPQSLQAQQETSSKEEKTKTQTKKLKKPKGSFEEAYIVANHGDTTYGYIRRQDGFRSQRQVKFADEYGVKTKYTTDRIKAYGFDEDHYEVIPTPLNFSGLFSESHIFLRRSLKGPASLFRFYTRRSVFTLKQGPAYIDLIKKPDGSLHEVSYNFKWVRIAEAFTDFPELANAIRNELFKPEDTPRIIDRYNKWYKEKEGKGN